MIGAMILGGLLTVGIMKFVHHRRHGCHWRWHHGGWEHEHRHERFWGGPRRSMWLRYLSDRLEASPAQERVIEDAVEEMRAEVKPLRAEAEKTRADLAAALRKPAFDEVLLGELFARHDSVMEKARKAFVGLVAKVHDTLDDGQRERLARLIERGPRFGW